MLTTSMRVLNTGGRKNFYFRLKSPFISEMVQDRPTVTMNHCVTFDDFE